MGNGKLVVIGGDAAGMGAASKVRRMQPDREIVVFEKGIYTSYAACGMPYFLAGFVDSHEDLIVRNPDVFRKKQNIDVRTLHEVIAIEPQKQRVKVRDLEKNRDFFESYNALLIATGAPALVPDLPGINSRGVFGFSGLKSGIEIFRYLEKENPKQALIAGGGYIGIEMAEALLERGLDVTLIDMAPQVMLTLDREMAEIISEALEEAGVQLFLEEKLEGMEADSNDRIKLVRTDKRTHKADLVILGVGIKPDASLAENAGIDLGVNGAIKINNRMQTSSENIWAAGDCATSFHLVKKQETHIALGTVATKHGLIAGINLSGGNAEFPGVLGTAITKFRHLEIARTGLSEQEASELKIACMTARIESSTRSDYYPGAEKITVKLVSEKSTGKLLGGQIVGGKGSGKRIDTIATAIHSGLTARQLVYMDLSYAPPFSPVWDPVQTAARQLL